MKELEKIIKEYLEERGWDDLKPGDLAKSVSIESAELLEIFQWDNPTLEETKQDKRRLERIKNELADVLMYCFQISVLLGLDTKGIMEKKLELVRQKYPVKLVKGDMKKYYQLKEEHRKK